MKNMLAAFALAVSLISCQKNVELVKSAVEPVLFLKADTGSFVKYTIAKGQQYCDKTTIAAVKYQQLVFQVRFDSSAIYQSVLPENQYDINKLYGFSDNKTQHHEYSARFGWRWSNDALRLFGYIYNKGVMSFQELGTVAIGSTNNCAIKIEKDKYVFILNGKETFMPRESITELAEGYKLFPYFGGDEYAPHTISIWIREM